MRKRWWIALIAGLPILLFVYYAVSPLFITLEINDLPPEKADMEESVTASVIGTLGHPASGTVRIVEAEGRTYVRYEGYETINGPDLFVYLAKDIEAKDFVNIGRLKATRGNVNYEIPQAIDISEYPYILTWCRAFGVLFNYAYISAH